MKKIPRVEALLNNASGFESFEVSGREAVVLNREQFPIAKFLVGWNVRACGRFKEPIFSYFTSICGGNRISVWRKAVKGVIGSKKEKRGQRND